MEKSPNGVPGLAPPGSFHKRLYISETVEFPTPKPNIIYYCHKVKHIPFDKTTKILETVRTETFIYHKFIVVDIKI